MTTTAADRKNHVVICGWRAEMGTLIREILKANPDWSAGDIVLVAPISDDRSRELTELHGLADVTVVREEAFHEIALEKASIRTAAKVMVLADESSPDASPTEIDARTIMTMMTIKRLAPDVYKIAEMLDPGFASYLKIADVDEIIYPREYSRFLIAGITASPGLAHTVYDLLRVDTPCVLTSVPIPDEFVGRTFGDFVRNFDDLPGDRRICIGLLENTGNIHVLRRRAKINAQKAGGYKAVIDNIRRVKEISSNRPVLNPGDDYVIRPFSLAVAVQTRDTASGQAIP